MRKLAIFGATGQVGSALVSLLGERAIAFTEKEANFSGSLEVIGELLNRSKPSAVINAAAYTQVDQAEKEEALALKINSDAPAVMAKWCGANGVPFVHYSTDYVFPGTGERPWVEEDPTDPLNVYGRSKLAGEKAVINSGAKDWLIFRTSWVYDAFGKNFLKTMLRVGSTNETLGIVCDQHGAPTYAPDLAEATLKALEYATNLRPFPSGTYHLCNAGETTWREFAVAIFEEAKKRGVDLKVKKVESILTKDYPTSAKRPLNSRMNTEEARRVLDVSLPDWRDGLFRCMEHIR